MGNLPLLPRLLASLLLAAAIAVTPARAAPADPPVDPYADAVAAIRRGDEEAATAIFQRACEEGSREACRRLAHQLYGLVGGQEKARERFAANCDSGDAESCYYLGARVLRDETAPEGLAAMQAALGKACDLGLGYACAAWGRALERTEPPANAPLAVAAFDQGCRLGTASACQAAAHRRSNDGTTPYFDLVVASDQMTMACDLGLGTACGDASILQLGVMGRPEWDIAPETWRRWKAMQQRACEAGDDEYCQIVLADELTRP